MWDARNSPLLREHIVVGVVHRPREVAFLYGFTRFEPAPVVTDDFEDVGARRARRRRSPVTAHGELIRRERNLCPSQLGFRDTDGAIVVACHRTVWRRTISGGRDRKCKIEWSFFAQVLNGGSSNVVSGEKIFRKVPSATSFVLSTCLRILAPMP
jgi:hypothetical protein